MRNRPAGAAAAVGIPLRLREGAQVPLAEVASGVAVRLQGLGHRRFIERKMADVGIGDPIPIRVAAGSCNCRVGEQTVGA